MSKLLEDTDYSDLDDFLPMASDSDVNMIETVIKWSKTFKYVLMEQLTKATYSENAQVIHVLRKIMTLLFDDLVLVNYSVFDREGTQKKKNFLNLKVCDIIFSTILEFDGFGDRFVDVKMKLKAYLSQAAYRLSRRDV